MNDTMRSIAHIRWKMNVKWVKKCRMNYVRYMDIIVSIYIYIYVKDTSEYEIVDDGINCVGCPKKKTPKTIGETILKRTDSVEGRNNFYLLEVPGKVSTGGERCDNCKIDKPQMKRADYWQM